MARPDTEFRLHFPFFYRPIGNSKGRMKIWIALFIALCAPAAAAAPPDETVIQEMATRTHLLADEIRRDYDACDSGVTLSMKICASYRWMIEDARLNRAYKHAVAKAHELGYESSLVRSQRAWLAFRDAACTYAGQMGAGGGSAEGLYVLSCKLDLTRQQADRIENSVRE